MGDLLTVSPSGPFDVLRNPALLPNQDAEDSLGLFYTYVHYIPGKSETDLKINITGFDFDSDVVVEDPRIFGMTCHLAYLSKSGGSAFGLAVTSLDNNQYRYSETETAISSISGTTEIKSHEQVKTKELNPVLISSAGFSISKNSFFGFQLLVKYSRIAEERISENIINDSGTGTIAEQDREKSEKTVTGIRGELGFGYFYKTNDIQAGLLIRSGDYSWIKKGIKINYNKIVGPGAGNYNSESDLTMSGERTSGPGIAAGGYKRISRFFAFAVESLFIFEHSYPNKDFNYDTDTNAISKEENIQSSKYSVALKGGIELNPSRNLAITLGLGYSIQQFESYQSNNQDNRSIASFNTKYIYNTSGIEYKIGKNIDIEMMAAYFFHKSKAAMINREDDGVNYIEFAQKSRTSGSYLFSGLGVVLKF